MSDHAHGDRPRIVMIGFSHLGALQRAQDARLSAGTAGFDADWFFVYPTERYDPWVRIEDGLAAYHPSIAADLRRIDAEQRPRAVFMSVWGNQHFTHSCARSVPSFDVVLPWATSRARIPDSDIVPFDLLDRLVRRSFDHYDGLVTLAKQMMRCPVHTLAAPPPVGPVQDLPAGSSSRELDDMVARFGLADPLLRWKFWSACEHHSRRFADSIGVRILAPPAGTADPEGYRRREFWGTDWIHANDRYAELVLRQIDAIIEDLPP